MPAKEEERDKVISQLSLKSKMDSGAKIDRFQEARKDELTIKYSNMGFDPIEIKDFLK